MKKLHCFLFAVLFLFASLSSAALIGDKCTWLATPEQIAALPVGTEYATLSDVLEAGPYEGTIFNHCRVVLTRSGLDLVFAGFLVCPYLYPNGTECYLEGNTLYTWETVLPPQDPLPGATNEDLLKSIFIRNIYIIDLSGIQQSLKTMIQTALRADSIKALAKAAVKPAAKATAAKK